MARPYQFLAELEPKLQKVLDRLEEKWANDERDQLVPTPLPYKHSNISLATAGKKQPVAPDSDTDSDTHAKAVGVFKKNEVILESPKEATSIDDEEVVKALCEQNLEQKTTAKPSSTEITDSVEALRLLKCLMQFIKIYLRPYWNTSNSAKCHKIQFVDLWNIFKPGENVFAPLGAETNAEVLNSPKNERGRDSTS